MFLHKCEGRSILDWKIAHIFLLLPPGLLLVRLLHGIKMNSSLGNKMADWAVRQSEKLIKNLESRKSLFEYTKYMAQMLHQVMTGIREALKKLDIFQRPGKQDPKLKNVFFPE